MPTGRCVSALSTCVESGGNERIEAYRRAGFLRHGLVEDQRESNDGDADDDEADAE
jgi:hypothetical protein